MCGTWGAALQERPDLAPGPQLLCLLRHPSALPAASAFWPTPRQNLQVPRAAHALHMASGCAAMEQHHANLEPLKVSETHSAHEAKSMSGVLHAASPPFLAAPQARPGVIYELPCVCILTQQHVSEGWDSLPGCWLSAQ